MFSYLPPDNHSPRSYQPGKSSLKDHQDNLVTHEWLARMWDLIERQKEKVVEVAQIEPAALQHAVGKLKGLEESLEVLETIAEAIRSGELREVEEDDDTGSEKVQ